MKRLTKEQKEKIRACVHEDREGDCGAEVCRKCGRRHVGGAESYPCTAFIGNRECGDICDTCPLRKTATDLWYQAE